MTEQQMTKEEQIGFHKGALQTLSNERNELARMLTIVDQLMQMHIQSLKELGVEIAPEQKQETKQGTTTKKPIEDMLK